MGLREEIASTYQVLKIELRVDGKIYSDMFEANVSMGFGQPNSQATIKCATLPPGADENILVELRAGYNGYMDTIFKGHIVGIHWGVWEKSVSLDCRSISWRLTLPYGGEYRTYSAALGNSDSAAVIRNLAEAYGITPETSGHYIEGDGDWTLAEIVDLEFNPGDTAWALIQRIDLLSGYETFTDSKGVLRRSKVRNTPSAIAAHTFTEGYNILPGTLLRRDLSATANVIKVDGLQWEGLTVFADVVGENEYIPDPPGYIVYTVQDNLIETEEKALEIANKILVWKNRRTIDIDLETIGNPLINLAQTISVTAPSLGLSDAKFLVKTVQHRITSSSFVTSISAVGGHLADSSEVGKPVAVIDLQFFRESRITDNGQRLDIIVGIADGTGSYDVDSSDPLTYSWSVTTDSSPATPSSSNNPVFQFMVDATVNIIQVVVNLTVTDNANNSNTASVEKVVDIEKLKIEDVWSAEGNQVAVSVDGQRTWRTQPAPASHLITCLCAIAIDYQVFGCTNGGVYASFDHLETPLVFCGTPVPGEAVTAVYMNEADNTRVWCGTSNGRIAFATADLEAKTISGWVVRGTVVQGKPIVEIEEAYNNFNVVSVTTDTTMYTSHDGGVTWTPVHVSTGTVARRMKSGFGKNFWGSEDASGTYLIRNAQGDSFSFVDAQNQPVNPGVIHCVQLGWLDPYLIGVDKVGTNPANIYRVYGVDGTAHTLKFLTTSLNGQPYNHIIRSGNERGVCYAACGAAGLAGGGIQKTFSHFDPGSIFYCRKLNTGFSYMVGYGSLSLGKQPLQPPYIYLVPVLQSGANDVLWRYNVNSQAWDSIALPVAGKQWDKVVVSPYDPKKIFIGYHTVGAPNANSGSYYSEDGGATWYEIKYWYLNTNLQRFMFVDPAYHDGMPFQSVIFTETKLSVFMIVREAGYYFPGVSYPFWGKTELTYNAQDQKYYLTLDFYKPGYWHDGNPFFPTSGRSHTSANYFDESGLIYRLKQRNAGGTRNPATAYIKGTPSGNIVTWSWANQTWNNGLVMNKFLQDSNMIHVGNGHLLYTHYNANYGNVTSYSVIDSNITLPSNYGNPPEIGGSTRWGHCCCKQGSKVYFGRTFNGAYGTNQGAGVNSMPISEVLTASGMGSECNTYSATNRYDTLGRNIVATEKHLAIMNVTQNHIIFKDGDQWGTLPLPPGVTSSMVSSFIGIGKGG